MGNKLSRVSKGEFQFTTGDVRGEIKKNTRGGNQDRTLSTFFSQKIAGQAWDCTQRKPLSAQQFRIAN